MKKCKILTISVLAFIISSTALSVKVRADWIKEGGLWKYLNGNTYVKSSWLQDKGLWYFFDSKGVMQSGWIIDKGNWYYLNDSGAMHTGWILYNNIWYYLDSSGKMLSDTRTPDGYYVNAKGEYIGNTSQTASQGGSSENFENEVIRLVNEKRIAKGLAPLSKSNELMEAANIRERELAQRYDHKRPDGSSPYTTINTSYRMAGENIAYSMGYDYNGIMEG